jgi:hypothetical protein
MGFIQAPTEHKVSVYMERPISGTPACSQDPRRFAFDVTSASGRALYSALLTAMHAKTAVHAHGNGTCDVSGAEETLQWVVVDAPLS